MSEKPVIILGAGATKACGGPLTNEILPAALNGEMEHDNPNTPVEDREELLSLSSRFLTECFNVPTARPVKKSDCPPLPMVLSMLRSSIEAHQPIGAWQGQDLVKAKRAIEYAIFAVIEAALRRMLASAQALHKQLLEPLYARSADVMVASLNYDVIVDNAMFALSDPWQNLHPPDYGVDIATNRYKEFRAFGTFGRLLKIHGSLNWLYCETCQRLDLFVSRGMRTSKALDELYHWVPFNDAYSCRGTPCRNQHCQGFVSPILVSPTFVKDYENPHIKRVWEQAESAMKQTDRAVFIGYSLPTDDFQVALLLKRGLNHLPRQRITVVEYVPGDSAKSMAQRVPLEQHPTGQRFRSLFGSGLDWQTIGFEDWLTEQRAGAQFPFVPD